MVHQQLANSSTVPESDGSFSAEIEIPVSNGVTLSELNRVKFENVELKQSLDQAAKQSEELSGKIIELETSAAAAQQELDRMIKLWKESQAQLNETRQRLSDVQERLTEITELENVATVSGQSRSENGDSVAVVKLQKQLVHTTDELSQTKDELNETRQRLSDVQERLTVAEQVTAATQQRALQQSDTSEQLELELTPEHQPTGESRFSGRILHFRFFHQK